MLRLKICGIKFKQNMLQVAEVLPDYMGFIFYPRSRRFMLETLLPSDLSLLPAKIKKVGVFVNETANEVLDKSSTYNLDTVQLHGNESPEMCETVLQKGLQVIKAFSIDESFDFNRTKAYHRIAHQFLFDTKTKRFGGSGQTFNWDLLKKYDQQTPFFVSGGIGVQELDQIEPLLSMNIYGLDLNSKLETEPGLKDVELVKQASNRVEEINSKLNKNTIQT